MRWSKSIIKYKDNRGFLWKKGDTAIQVWKPRDEWLVITTGEVATGHKTQKEALKRAKYMRRVK